LGSVSYVFIWARAPSNKNREERRRNFILYLAIKNNQKKINARSYINSSDIEIK